MWVGFQFFKSIKVLLADCGSACVQRAAFKEYTGVISPRLAQVNVPWDTTMLIHDGFYSLYNEDKEVVQAEKEVLEELQFDISFG